MQQGDTAERTKKESPRARRRHLGIVALGLVLVFLVFGGTTHEGRRAVERDIASGHFAVTPANVVRGLRAYLTNEDDMYRCWAYAQALLGRPYRSYFLRTRPQWDEAFARGEATDPDTMPVVTPPRPLVPYRDFLVEYPPGFFLVLMPPALLSSTPDGYALGFKLEMALSLIFCAYAALALLRRSGDAAGDTASRVAGAFAAAILAMGLVTTHRFDAFVAALMMATALAAVRGRAAAAGVALGLAVAAKGVPLLIAPALLIYLWAERGRRAALVFTLVAAVVTVGFCAAAVAWCGDGVIEAVAYHRDRPVQIESTPGALLIFGDWLRPGLVTIVHSFSSRNVRGDAVPAAGAVATGLAALAMLAAMALSVLRLRAAREPQGRLRALLEGVVPVLAAYVTLGKVFCPQYLVWLLPFALTAAFLPGHGSARRWVGLALLIATQLIYPITYASLKAKAPWAAALVLARNLGVLAWSVSLPANLAWPGARDAVLSVWHGGRAGGGRASDRPARRRPRLPARGSGDGARRRPASDSGRSAGRSRRR